MKTLAALIAITLLHCSAPTEPQRAKVYTGTLTAAMYSPGVATPIVNGQGDTAWAFNVYPPTFDLHVKALTRQSFAMVLCAPAADSSTWSPAPSFTLLPDSAIVRLHQFSTSCRLGDHYLVQVEE